MAEGRVDRFHCPESVSGHGSADIQGNCPYCRFKLEPKFRPTLNHKAKSQLDDAYGYHWDPDYGKPE